MKHTVALLAICIIISFLTVSCVSANDMNNATMTSDRDLVEVDATEIDSQSTSQNNESSSSQLLASGNEAYGTFKDLANEINKSKGELNLNKDYYYSASDDLEYKNGIPIDKRITINGNGHTISGKEQAKALKFYAINVVLNNIKFIDCFGAVYLDGKNGTIINCNFGNCHATNEGGAIKWGSNSNGIIANCNFVNCHADHVGGGAVEGCQADIILTTCSFKNCYSNDDWFIGGGAVSQVDEINGCSFVNCHSANDGGAVYGVDKINGCSFVNCSAENNGGAIFFGYGNYILANSIFKGNSANNGRDIYSKGYVDVINMTADKISSAIIAPSLNTETSSRLIITLKDMNNNDFIVGEEISMSLNGKTYTETTDFNGQATIAIPDNLPMKEYVATITYNGNNMYYPSRTTTYVDVEKMNTRILSSDNAERMEFVLTLTTAEGKPLSNEKVYVDFNDTRFTSNTDSEGKFKISTAQLPSGRYDVYIFYDGSSRYNPSYGFAYAYVNVEPAGTLVDLNNEIANANGQFDLTRNYTSEGYQGKVIIDKSIVINGNGYTINGGNEASIFNICADNVTIRNINFINSGDTAITWNEVKNGNLTNCSFTNCLGNYNRLTRNYGGVVVFKDCGDCIISDCSFVNCSGKKNDGGAVYLYDTNNGIITGCSFVNCSATNYGGGAVYWSGTNGIMTDCSFVNCTAPYDGGAVYWLDENGALTNCIFVNCSAGYGGAVTMHMNCANSVAANCSFINCRAKIQGGAICWDGDDGYVCESSFMNCHAGENGGGIYFKGANCSLIYPTFKGNTAQNGSDWYSAKPLNVINDTKIETAISAPDMNAGYGVTKNLIVTLKDTDNHILIGKQVSIVLDNIRHVLKTDSRGQVSIPTNNLNLGDHTADIAFAGDDIYNSSSATSKITISKAKPRLVAKYDNGYIVATVKDETGNPISGLEVGFAVNGVKYATTDENGQAKYSLSGLKEGSYSAKVLAYGNEFYLNSDQKSIRFTFSKMATKLTAKYDANSKNIIAAVKDSDGNPVSGMKVGFAVNGVKYVTTDENGQAKYSTADLADGSYKATIMAYDNGIYKDSNKETVTFTVGNKAQTKIFLRNALYFVTQTKMVQVTLWDANNQPLANKTVYIRAYDSVWKGVTDENGDAYIRVGIGFGTHDATVSFDGDDQYNASTKAGYIRVIKQTPSVMVRGADTMFKASDNNKIVKVHLRDRYDKALPEGSKIALKLNGKTYVGTTDINGVASIKINIYTVGTFTAQAMYGGNTAYNAVTRDVKIRIV